jgi:hypothetical protein
MQMEQAKEQRKRDLELAIAKQNVDKAQAQNAALDKLIQVWGAGRR